MKLVSLQKTNIVLADLRKFGEHAEILSLLGKN